MKDYIWIVICIFTYVFFSLYIILDGEHRVARLERENEQLQEEVSFMQAALDSKCGGGRWRK